MKKFKHVTKEMTATMTEPNVLIVDGTNERLEVSDITLRRWWKEVEQEGYGVPCALFGNMPPCWAFVDSDFNN